MRLALLVLIAIIAVSGSQAEPQLSRAREDAIWARIDTLRLETWDPSTPAEQQILLCDQALELFAQLGPLAEPDRLIRGAFIAMRGYQYWNRIDGDRAENLERAIADLEDSLKWGEVDQEESARRRISLGNAYGQRVRGDKPQNLEKALQAYASADPFLTGRKRTAAWAELQLNRGTVLSLRISGDVADNQEKALAALLEARDIFTLVGNARALAVTNQTLGAVYRKRIRGEFSENIDRALAHMEASLSGFPRGSREADREWAMARLNLATIYLNRVQGKAQDNTERAIELANTALSILTPDLDPLNSSLLRRILSRAYLGREAGDRAANIEAAIASANAARTRLTRRVDIDALGDMNEVLAAAYSARILGNRSENLENARVAAEEALQMRPRDRDPSAWARVTVTLASIYLDRVERNASENLSYAIELLEDALTVYTPGAAPRSRLNALGYLSTARARQRDWAGVGAVTDERLAIMNDLGGAGLNTTEVRELAAAGGNVGLLAAYASWKRSDAEGAWRRLEAGTGRALQVSLGFDRLKLSLESRAQLDRLRAEIRETERIQPTSAATERLALTQKLSQLRQQASAIVESADTASPTTITDQLRAALRNSSVVLAPVYSEAGGVVLVAYMSGGRVMISGVAAPEFSDTFIASTLNGSKVTGSPGWFQAYVSETSIWRSEVNSIGAVLARPLGQPISEALRLAGAGRNARIAMLAPGVLGVLPLELMRDPATGRVLIEDYEITQAPTLSSLSRTLAAAGERRVFVIANPSGNLPGAAVEGSAVASWGQADSILSTRAPDKSAVFRRLANASVWHFAAHARFDWDTPRESSIDLGGGQVLTVEDIAEVAGRRPPSLVFLSACESGLAFDSRYANEFIGLPASFIVAGARTVIGTLWQIPDAPAALLTMKFYELLWSGAARPSNALRAAQLWIRDASLSDIEAFVQIAEDSGRISADQADLLIGATMSSPTAGAPYRDPVNWAGFIAIGE